MGVVKEGRMMIIPSRGAVSLIGSTRIYSRATLRTNGFVPADSRW